MGVTVRTQEDVTIIEAAGKMRIGQGGVNVWETILQALEAGGRKILLDLTGVTDIDSSGVGELVASQTSAANRGARLKVAGLSPKLAEVLQITHLLGVLETYDYPEEALVAFKQS